MSSKRRQSFRNPPQPRPIAVPPVAPRRQSSLYAPVDDLTGHECFSPYTDRARDQLLILMMLMRKAAKGGEPELKAFKESLAKVQFDDLT